MKCAICNNKVEEMFLGKLKGTLVKDGKKQKVICSECQKKHSMEEIKKQI